MSDNQPFREETGQVTSIRALPATPEGANYEIALSTEGTIETTKYSALWSYAQIQRNDGSIYGSGDGLLATDCGEVFHLKGSGSAPTKEADGSVIFKVINHHHTFSAKFEHLNGVAATGVYKVSPDGQTTAQFDLF